MYKILTNKNWTMASVSGATRGISRKSGLINSGGGNLPKGVIWGKPTYPTWKKYYFNQLNYLHLFKILKQLYKINNKNDYLYVCWCRTHIFTSALLYVGVVILVCCYLHIFASPYQRRVLILINNEALITRCFLFV